MTARLRRALGRRPDTSVSVGRASRGGGSPALTAEGLEIGATRACQGKPVLARDQGCGARAREVTPSIETKHSQQFERAMPLLAVSFQCLSEDLCQVSK